MEQVCEHEAAMYTTSVINHSMNNTANKMFHLKRTEVLLELILNKLNRFCSFYLVFVEIYNQRAGYPPLMFCAFMSWYDQGDGAIKTQ